MAGTALEPTVWYAVGLLGGVGLYMLFEIGPFFLGPLEFGVGSGALLLHTHHLTAQEYLHFQTKRWLHSNKQGSNTMPLRHRPDFKQALSTLQRLQQEAEEPQVPTYSYKHQQWEARISSSTWWNWQGSWWTPYHSESQDGDAPSIK